ncbi:MAG: NAD(P)/FAD-dependent oxidoreductase [Actinomycetales bacterium]
MPHQTADAVVIGAGVIGCSVARSLAAGGRDVLVVDKLSGPGQGSTSSSSAIIRFNYSTLAGVATAWESHYAWLDWQNFLGGPDQDGGVARFIRTGALSLDAPVHDPGKVLRLFDQVGVPYEVWTAEQVREHFAWLDPARHYPPKALSDEAFWDEPDGEVGGYHCPDAGFVDDPGYAAHNLATSAQRLGVRFSMRTEVSGVDTSSGRVTGVMLADGTRIDTPVVVNVGGPASPKINSMAGVGDDFGIGNRPVRVEVNTVPVPAGFDPPDRPGPIVSDMDLGTYLRGTPSGDLIVGGAEPECDPVHYVEDGEDFDRHVTAAISEAQLLRAARRVPALQVPNTPKGIAACYDVADDWIPIYDKTAVPGFYVAIGTSGNQFKNAPVVGDYLRAIIDACESGHDHDTDPVRHTLPRTGLQIDLSAYSRLRQPDPNSSNTVMG